MQRNNAPAILNALELLATAQCSAKGAQTCTVGLGVENYVRVGTRKTGYSYTLFKNNEPDTVLTRAQALHYIATNTL